MKCLRSILPILLLSLPAYSQSGRPEIVGQRPVSTNEDQAVTVRLFDLFVVDQDDFYPWGFTLTVYEGANYTFSQHTVTPNLNYHGVLTVPVSVNDGTHESKKFDLKITVNPVNDPPVITGQSELQTRESTTITLQLSNLIVEDPDDIYPNGFSLAVQSGNNYTVSGTSVTPNQGFIGSLKVPVTVNDGKVNSAPFNVNIIVLPRSERPVITGQVPLTTSVNKSLTIELTHLQVTDPDNTYPNDFTLTIYDGSNYTFTGRTVTPANNFTGTLSVRITVNDGTSNSEPFDLKINVSNELHISGQVVLEINEDEPLTLQLSHLTVYDPNNRYPSGFSLVISNGNNYAVNGVTIKPAANYSGTLTVPVAVRNNATTSKPFNVIVTVKPVNDAPAITTFPQGPLRYTIGTGAAYIFKEIEITDVDDERLAFSEISIRSDNYRKGNEELVFQPTPGVQGIFDTETGILSLAGNAAVAEYQQVLRSIQYNYTNTENPVPETKTIYIKLSDGKISSEPKERQIIMRNMVELDIPTCFTPNNDAANDTWRIRPLISSERFTNAMVRVFNRRGVLIFESKGFEKEWDGRYNGELVPADTYYYIIDLNVSSSASNYRGVVNVLR